jgi:flagellar FliL protein
MQQHPSTEAKAQKPATAAGACIFRTDTFTVNLGDADRVLYIGITLRLKDDAMPD